MLSDAYERYLTLFFSHPAVHGMVLWGFWDARMWIAGGGLFDVNRTEKLAGRVGGWVGGGRQVIR